MDVIEAYDEYLADPDNDWISFHDFAAGFYDDLDDSFLHARLQERHPEARL